MTELTKWAKVIDLDNGDQVLYYQEYDPSEDKDIIHRICNVDDLRIDAAFTRVGKEFTQEEFDNVTTKELASEYAQAMGQRLRDEISKIKDRS